MLNKKIIKRKASNRKEEGLLESTERYKEENVTDLCKLKRHCDDDVLRHENSKGSAVGLTLLI